MTSVVPFAPGQISRVFGNGPVVDDLSAGVQASFGVIGYKGKVWSIKYRGEEVQLLRPDGDGARNSIEVVLLASAKNLSKIYYASGYTEGANAAPDCFSTDGVVPSASATSKQSPTCASCPQNVWGSKISEVSGKPTKRCADSKRIALVPLQDIPNEIYGGPLLLRVPAASLQEMAQYGQKMQQLGYPSYAIGTRISFDTEVSYPRFQFQAIRPLNDDEAVKVMEMRNSAAVSRILAEATELTSAPVINKSALEAAFELPPKVTTQDQSWTIPASPLQAQKPSTGQVYTTSVQPAGQDRGVSQEPSPVKAPATVSPQPTQVAPTSPAPSTVPAGGATTASTEQKSGFGNTTPVTADLTPTTPSKEATDTAFEAGLDDLMTRLLPSSSTTTPR
jgi:hypothetical protein